MSGDGWKNRDGQKRNFENDTLFFELVPIVNFTLPMDIVKEILLWN